MRTSSATDVSPGPEQAIFCLLEHGQPAARAELAGHDGRPYRRFSVAYRRSEACSHVGKAYRVGTEHHAREEDVDTALRYVFVARLGQLCSSSRSRALPGSCRSLIVLCASSSSISHASSAMRVIATPGQRKSVPWRPHDARGACSVATTEVENAQTNALFA